MLLRVAQVTCTGHLLRAEHYSLLFGVQRRRPAGAVTARANERDSTLPSSVWRRLGTGAVWRLAATRSLALAFSMAPADDLILIMLDSWTVELSFPQLCVVRGGGGGGATRL